MEITLNGQSRERPLSHQSAIYREGIADLREGDSVEFEVGQGPKGPWTENVRRTSRWTDRPASYARKPRTADRISAGASSGRK